MSIWHAHLTFRSLPDRLVGNESFNDMLRGHWLGDGVMLGLTLTDYLAPDQSTVVFYPAQSDSADIDKAPFRYINFLDKPYYYFFPGRFVADHYPYLLQEAQYEALKVHPWIQVRGRYQTFFLIQPEGAAASKYRMYRFLNASLIVPDGLIE